MVTISPVWQAVELPTPEYPRVLISQIAHAIIDFAIAPLSCGASAGASTRLNAEVHVCSKLEGAVRASDRSGLR